jgi:hypothetical protein
MRIFAVMSAWTRVSSLLPAAQIDQTGGTAIVAKPLDRGGFKHDAQIVKLVEPGKVERQDRPSTAECDLDETLAPELIQRLADRRAGNLVALG